MFKHQTRISASSLLFTCVLICSPVVGTCAEFHIAPDGQADGDGSKTGPWNLARALAHPQAVKPGDILWLHGGTYRGTFISRLEGTANKPIVVRQVPGERATLDAADAPKRDSTVVVHGNYTSFQDFEITNSSAQRSTTAGGSHPDDLTLNGSIDIYSGHGHKLINLVVHHCSAGPSAWLEAIDAEAYGCIVYNNGWDAPDRGHGHAFYWQNDEGTKRLVDNILFNQFSHGIHIYGSSRAWLNNFHPEGNIAFNNGAMSERTGHTRNILIGGGRRAEDITLIDNVTYYSEGGSNIVGYGQGAGKLTMTDNYLASPQGTAVEITAEAPKLSGNTFVGRVGGVEPADHADNTYHGSQHPGGVAFLVRPNRYEVGRAHIAVFNWDRQESVEVELSETGLEQGDRFKIVDAQNYFGEPLATGRYDGSPVKLSMTGLSVADPVAGAPIKPPHTSPEFAAFVVQKAR